MNIKRVYPSGFCQGVILALQKVRKAAEENPGVPIYILGMIVHNSFVVEAIRQLGIISLDDAKSSKEQLLDTIDEGIVIFTAHGISNRIKQKAIDKGLKVIDASCPFVLKNEELISSYLDKGYEVIYIGKKNHPESDAVIDLSDKVHLVEKECDLEELKVNTDRILVTNQTTMSVFDTNELIEKIKARYPEAIVAEEICDATRLRQQAIMKLQDTDMLIVVGDPRSNNTEQLCSIGRRCGIKEVYKFETAADVPELNLENKNISVTAGASTPKYLTDNVIRYLQTGNEEYRITDIDHILD